MTGPILVAVALGACQGKGEDALESGSSTMVALGSRLYAIDPDGGTLARIEPATGATSSTPVGLDPRRVAGSLVGDKATLWVTLGDRTVARFTDDGSGPVLTDQVEVGAEPTGLVFDPLGNRVYVALWTEDRVVALDADTLAVLESFDAPAPRWLALAGQHLFAVGSREITSISLDDGFAAGLTTPVTGFGHPAGKAEARGRHNTETFDGRFTGDPCVTPDGRLLVVPTLFADTRQPIVTSEHPREGSPYGASQAVSVARFNPSLMLIPLDHDGAPADPEDDIPVLAAAESVGVPFRAIVTSATCAPDGHRVLATTEGRHSVSVVDLDPFASQGRDPVRPAMADRTNLAHAGFHERPTNVVQTSGGPRGAAFVGEKPWVHAVNDHQIEPLPWDDAVDVNVAMASDRKGQVLMAPVNAGHAIQIAQPTLGPDLEAGRELFLSTDDPDIADPSGGVSCATCHTDGREDGFTWQFVTGPRQTPSLAGGIAETGPYTWEGNVATVGDEAMITSTLRMGSASGPTLAQQAALEAYLNSVFPPDQPTQDPSAVARGKALFGEVGCDSCHLGDAFTDGYLHEVIGGVYVNTPTLRGIAATAPYYHDGAAPSLHDAMLIARDLGTMGDLSALTDADLRSIEAYLRTL